MKPVHSLWKIRLSFIRNSLAGLMLAYCCVGQPSWATNEASNGVANTALPDTPNKLESGAPLLRAFTPKDYGGFGQNWAIVQDKRGLIYAGNADGVLEYDGVHWRRIPVANHTVVRSLAVDTESGRVYVGAVGEIGYLQAGTDSKMQYVSLNDLLPTEAKHFADVWNTFVTPDGVIFSSYERLFRIKDKQVQSWDPHERFHYSFQVGKRILVQELGRGLLELVGKELKPLVQGEQFSRERIFALVKANMQQDDTHLLIGTRGLGFFTHDGQQLQPWKSEIDEALKRDLLYRGTRLSDGRLAIGTMQGGLYLLDQNAHWVARLDQSVGLLDNGVYSAMLDHEGGLWLGLGRGIMRLEANSPLSHYDEHTGLEGTVYNIARHQGQLYAGTAKDLYHLEVGPTAHFTPIPGLQRQGQTWASLSFKDRLIVAGYQGITEVKGNTVTPLLRGDFGAAMIIDKRDPDRIFIGLRTGVTSMSLKNGAWKNEGKIVGLSDEVRTIWQDKDARLWVGTNTAGVLRITFPAMWPQAGTPHIERFGLNDGLPSLNRNWVYPYLGEAVFGSQDGILHYNEKSQMFEKDPRFSALFPEPNTSVSNLLEAPEGLWMVTRPQSSAIETVSLARHHKDGQFKSEDFVFHAIAGSASEGMHRLFRDPQGAIWYGGDEGLFRFDPSIAKNYVQDFPLVLRQITSASGHVIYQGTGTPPLTQLSHADNRLRFEFAALSYDGSNTNQYQVWLEGSDQAWSNWSQEALMDYSNLWEGDYTLKVKARNRNNKVVEQVLYRFHIAPPWYRSIWAFFVYLVLIASLIWALLQWRMRQLHAQKRHLKQLVAERTQQLLDASLTDPLTGLRNRRFITEVMQNDLIAFTNYKNFVLHSSNSRETNTGREVFGVFLLDMDHFKEINDVYGHNAGDQILKQFSAILINSVRRDDVVVRLGGEEFLIVLKNTKPEFLDLFALKLLKKIASTPFDLGAHKIIHKTASIGYCAFPIYDSMPDFLSFEHAVMIADMAMYYAKNNGRNQAVHIKPGDKIPQDKEAIQKAISSLDYAIAENYFCIGGIQHATQ